MKNVCNLDMNRLRRLAAVCLTILLGCVVSQAFRTRLMTGTIGTDPIKMVLVLYQNDVRGYYYYLNNGKSGERIKLDGTYITDDGLRFEIKMKGDLKDSVTDTFDIELIRTCNGMRNQNQFKANGICVSPDGSKQNFYVSEDS